MVDHLVLQYERLFLIVYWIPFDQSGLCDHVLFPQGTWGEILLESFFNIFCFSNVQNTFSRWLENVYAGFFCNNISLNIFSQHERLANVFDSELVFFIWRFDWNSVANFFTSYCTSDWRFKRNSLIQYINFSRTNNSPFVFSTLLVY